MSMSAHADPVVVDGAGVDETPAAVKAALELAPAATEDDVLAAIEHLSNAVHAGASKLVAQGIALRRVRRIHRSWALAFASRDPDGFACYLAVAPAEGFSTATAELAALIDERLARRGLAGALEDIAAEHPDLIAEVRREASATEEQP